jgi:hypothetical protein
VFSLIYLFIKLMWLMFVLMFWLTWVLIALPVVVIASATGHQRAARQWQRSMRWRHIDIF